MILFGDRQHLVKCRPTLMLEWIWTSWLLGAAGSKICGSLFASAHVGPICLTLVWPPKRLIQESKLDCPACNAKLIEMHCVPVVQEYHGVTVTVETTVHKCPKCGFKGIIPESGILTQFIADVRAKVAQHECRRPNPAQD